MFFFCFLFFSTCLFSLAPTQQIDIFFSLFDIPIWTQHSQNVIIDLTKAEDTSQQASLSLGKKALYTTGRLMKKTKRQCFKKSNLPLFFLSVSFLTYYCHSSFSSPLQTHLPSNVPRSLTPHSTYFLDLPQIPSLRLTNVPSQIKASVVCTYSSFLVNSLKKSGLFPSSQHSFNELIHFNSIGYAVHLLSPQTITPYFFYPQNEFEMTSFLNQYGWIKYPSYPFIKGNFFIFLDKGSHLKPAEKRYNLIAVKDDNTHWKVFYSPHHNPRLIEESRVFKEEFSQFSEKLFEQEKVKKQTYFSSFIPQSGRSIRLDKPTEKQFVAYLQDDNAFTRMNAYIRLRHHTEHLIKDKEEDRMQNIVHLLLKQMDTTTSTLQPLFKILPCTLLMDIAKSYQLFDLFETSFTYLLNYLILSDTGYRSFFYDFLHIPYEIISPHQQTERFFEKIDQWKTSYSLLIRIKASTTLSPEEYFLFENHYLILLESFPNIQKNPFFEKSFRANYWWNQLTPFKQKFCSNLISQSVKKSIKEERRVRHKQIKDQQKQMIFQLKKDPQPHGLRKKGSSSAKKIRKSKPINKGRHHFFIPSHTHHTYSITPQKKMSFPISDLISRLPLLNLLLQDQPHLRKKIHHMNLEFIHAPDQIYMFENQIVSTDKALLFVAYCPCLHQEQGLFEIGVSHEIFQILYKSFNPQKSQTEIERNSHKHLFKLLDQSPSEKMSVSLQFQDPILLSA